MKTTVRTFLMTLLLILGINLEGMPIVNGILLAIFVILLPNYVRKAPQ